MKQVTSRTPILLAGLPRSGTTWVGQIMSEIDDSRYIFEPDNEKINAYGWLCKEHLHRFPFIENNGGQNVSKLYERLWYQAFSGKLNSRFDRKLFTHFFSRQIPGIESAIGDKTQFSYINSEMKDVAGSVESSFLKNKHHFIYRTLAKIILYKPFVVAPSPSQIVVKSVHSSLSLNWIKQTYSPDIVIILRNPYALFASYVRMKMPDGMRNILAQPSLIDKLKEWKIDTTRKTSFLDEMAFQICCQFKYLEEFISEKKHAHVVSHDKLCLDPINEYQTLFQELDLNWTNKIEKKIKDSNKAGSGFKANRISSEQPLKWKKELSDKECETIEYWIDSFNLSNFIKKYIC